MPTMPTSNTITMTVNLDKTASLSRQYFGSQGEDIEITVVVPVGLSGSGYDAYIDFIQPDGLAYFKGPYDCSSGTFSFFIGVLDSLMDKDGDLSWQFLLAETAGSVRTVKWAANRYKSPIYPSVGATSAAVLPYVPQMVYPSEYLAALITLVDAAGRFTATEVEAALAELAGSGRTTQTVKANADAIALKTISAYTNITLTNNWTNQSIGTYGAARYCLDHLGIVRLAGVIKAPTDAGERALSLGTLVAEARPLHQKWLVISNLSTKVAHSINVLTDGTMVIYPTVGSAEALDLSSLSWRVG